jgi:hypothetical protein
VAGIVFLENPQKRRAKEAAALREDMRMKRALVSRQALRILPRRAPKPTRSLNHTESWTTRTGNATSLLSTEIMPTQMGSN